MPMPTEISCVDAIVNMIAVDLILCFAAVFIAIFSVTTRFCYDALDWAFTDVCVCVIAQLMHNHTRTTPPFTCSTQMCKLLIFFSRKKIIIMLLEPKWTQWNENSTFRWVKRQSANGKKRNKNKKKTDEEWTTYVQCAQSISSSQLVHM